MLQETARIVANLVGRESSVARRLRPAFEETLDYLSFGKGISRKMNGSVYRVVARHRNRFPPEYEPGLAALLRRRVKPNATCLNVGANLGVYALQLARWSSPHGKVIAFEPNPMAREVLTQHVKLNGFSSQIQIESFAVGATSEKATLYAADCDGMSRLGVPNREIADIVKQVPVDVVRLDEFCSRNRIRPDLIVMDIEGAEIAALLGASELIRDLGKKLSIFVEMHPAVWEPAPGGRKEVETIFKYLRRRIVALSGQSDPLHDYGHVELVHQD